MKEKEASCLISFACRQLGFERVLCCSNGTDRRHHQSGAFIRAVLSSGSRRFALIAAPEWLPASMVGRFLADLVMWWDKTSEERDVLGMVLLVPSSWRQGILGLLPILRIPLSCFEYELSTSGFREIFPKGGELPALCSPYIVYPGCPPPGILEETKNVFPDLDLIFRRHRWELSHCGLPVVWMENSGSCWFNFRDPRLVIRFPEECRSHIRNVLGIRAGLSSNRNTFSYMFGPERWLESLLIKDLSRVRPGLGPRFYCQVPSRLGKERKILDILAADEQGLLVVLEVKAECRIEDIFQGFGYRERVNHHLRDGDFQKKGYFQGIELKDSVPVLGFVSPLFSFHRTLPVIWKYLIPGGEVFFVGINSDWRDGIKTLRRFSLEPGSKRIKDNPYS
jgi:hypothetical protein